MLSVFIIGSGKIATHLARALYAVETEVRGVYSRNRETADELARQVNSKYVEDTGSIPRDADLYLLAVNDDSIAEVSEKLRVDGIVAHCSGLKPMSLLEKHPHRGIFYPLQTFATGTQPEMGKVPVCIEAGSDEDLRILEAFADRISHSVHFVNSDQRQHLHLAAVLANNFGNHLFAQAEKICRERGIDFGLLLPLIRQTAENAAIQSPGLNQTGPAVRNDMETISRHLELLGNNPPLQTLYQVLTESIRKLQGK